MQLPFSVEVFMLFEILEVSVAMVFIIGYE